MPEQIVVGFDLATKTGWAVKQGSTILASGVQDFTKRRGESNGILFMRLRRWLLDFFNGLPQKPLAVGYEQAHFRGAGTELLLGMQTHLQGVCAELRIESIGVHTGTLKKSTCGSGKASKDEMVAKAREIINREPEDDNEADAIHVSTWTHNEFIFEGTDAKVNTGTGIPKSQGQPVRVRSRRERSSRGK